MRVPGDRPQDEIEPRAGRGHRRGVGQPPLATDHGWPWRTGLRPPSRRLALDPDRVRRLAELTSPAFAAAVGGHSAASAIDAGTAHRSRLFNQFARQGAQTWAARLLREGVEVLCLGALGNAAAYADDPDVQPIEHAELLVRRRDRARLAGVLRRHGLDVGADVALAPDGSLRLAIVTQAAPWPLARALNPDMLFAESRPATVDEVRIRIAAPTHALLLAAARAAANGFGAGSLPQVIDAAAILRRAGDEIDWLTLTRLARRGRIRGAVSGFFALLDRLGFDLSMVPAPIRRQPRGAAAAELARVVADFEALFPRPPSRGGRFRRHWLLTGGPLSACARGWR
ncbi:MAG: nucleotidyltransferase family protein [Alphaproteobacteria bacterium]